MISFDEATRIICDAAGPAGTETLAIGECAGRVLASPVIARIDSPRCDVSAMDGYAVREADLTTGRARLAVVGTSFPGQGWSGEIVAGQCVRIFTGAPVPSGADRIVIQERVTRDDGVAQIDLPPGEPRFIRKRGGDFDQGSALLAAGRRLDPRGIVAAAAADLPQVEVFAMPRVAIIATGDELVCPGTAADRRFAIPDSISPGIAALVAEQGGELAWQTRQGDDLAALQSAAATATGLADLVIVIGGASVGEKDFAKAMFEPLGLELMFAGVAMKPGKPSWFGRAQGTYLLGLPGNPTSALVTARLFLGPLLAGLSGMDPRSVLSWRHAVLAAPLGECGARETFHRARLGPSGVEILEFQESSAQHALAKAGQLVRQPARTPALEQGATVEILDF